MILMKKPSVRVFPVLALCFAFAALVALVPRAALASDHADPIGVSVQESNLTGLFFYPKDDQMILILNTYPKLTKPGPYDLEPYEFAIYMDLHSQVSYDKAEDLARYGGTVVNPDGISPDVTIKFRLNNDTSVKSKTIEGLPNAEAIRVWTGVRDDPFILPRFFGTNVVSMVLSIPMSSFKADQQDWLLWATASKDGNQIDHDGRSNRTQLARFDFLNTVAPKDQVAAIMKQAKKILDAEALLNKFKATAPLSALLKALSEIRPYDFFPDVMIYTTRFPPGFPNGRQLTDDIVGLTCQQGDCLLFESAYAEGKWPRQLVNDKPFLDEFPYLAEPWPEKPPTPKPAAWGCWPFVVIALLLLVLVIWLLRRWCRKRGGR
jgi:hypothetical protein